jgi:tetratricopeptide (TPR) repeat protein
MGEIREELVFPFPALAEEERESLRMIVDSFRAFAGDNIAELLTPAVCAAIRDFGLNPECLDTAIADQNAIGYLEFHIEQGGHEQAREYLELAQGRLREEMNLPISGLIQRLTGQLEAASGRLAEAKQHIAQSVSIFTTTEIPFELARSYYSMGLLLSTAHDPKGAEANLVQAKAIFERLGAEPDLFLDGRCCCDQSAAHHLVRSGLIAASRLGLVGQRVAAALTPAGHEALGAFALAA